MFCVTAIGSPPQLPDLLHEVGALSPRGLDLLARVRQVLDGPVQGLPRLAVRVHLNEENYKRYLFTLFHRTALV